MSLIRTGRRSCTGVSSGCVGNSEYGHHQSRLRAYGQRVSYHHRESFISNVGAYFPIIRGYTAYSFAQNRCHCPEWRRAISLDSTCEQMGAQTHLPVYHPAWILFRFGLRFHEELLTAPRRSGV